MSHVPLDGYERAGWAAAFVAAQAEFPRIAKTKTATIPTKSGGQYSYSYADLGDVIDAVRPVLHKHGLAVMQSVTSEQDGVGVETRIMHQSGWVELFGPLVMRPAGGDPQSAGSAVTYARRYALTAALGIVTEDDDDGQAATHRQEPKPGRAKEAKDWTVAAKKRAVEIAGGKEAAALLYANAVTELALGGQEIGVAEYDPLVTAMTALWESGNG